MITYKKEDLIKLIQDKEEISQKGAILQKSDLVIASVERIAELLDESMIDPKNIHKEWKITEIAKNAAGETIGVKVMYQSSAPSWLTPELLEWIES